LASSASTPRPAPRRQGDPLAIVFKAFGRCLKELGSRNHKVTKKTSGMGQERAGRRRDLWSRAGEPREKLGRSAPRTARQQRPGSEGEGGARNSIFQGRVRTFLTYSVNPPIRRAATTRESRKARCSEWNWSASTSGRAINQVWNHQTQSVFLLLRQKRNP